jgi:hypothetical protein
LNNINNHVPRLCEETGCVPAPATDLVPEEENMSILMKYYNKIKTNDTFYKEAVAYYNVMSVCCFKTKCNDLL